MSWERKRETENGNSNEKLHSKLIERKHNKMASVYDFLLEKLISTNAYRVFSFNWR